ncbi:hypothetical protein SMSP2_01719 [Limihaloglobus sulfuriphilus]|uniref:Uncharacterized protein n=1 Tax=Limihaloglobus sulfuriphilus TaxID=1851148 RepID=A0A1Q2MF71_9BACT|nr:hypothetical protein [Limihaloglobus sulfuriphilus]AQQ71346.1 hypothetical protein SMSP2_01719 [Limihaloglobus sulfuriphilus]
MKLSNGEEYLTELILKASNGELTVSEQMTLNDLLASDPENLEYYARFMDSTGILLNSQFHKIKRVRHIGSIAAAILAIFAASYLIYNGYLRHDANSKQLSITGADNHPAIVINYSGNDDLQDISGGTIFDEDSDIQLRIDKLKACFGTESFAHSSSEDFFQRDKSLVRLRKRVNKLQNQPLFKEKENG